MGEADRGVSTASNKRLCVGLSWHARRQPGAGTAASTRPAADRDSRRTWPRADPDAEARPRAGVEAASTTASSADAATTAGITTSPGITAGITTSAVPFCGSACFPAHRGPACTRACREEEGKAASDRAEAHANDESGSAE